MNRSPMLAALGAALLALPVAVQADDRLVEREYKDSEVVRIEGKLGVQATIAFGDNESIENVAVGDSQAWQITPNKRANLLFVKPLDATARTNMTVVTDKHTYFFDLVPSAKARPLYMMRFTYAEEEKAQAATAAAASDPASVAALTPGEQSAISEDPLEKPLDPALLNFAWKRKGSGKIAPSRIYDDGTVTYLLFGAKREVPAILVMNEKGEEGPVNYTVRGNTIVLDSVPKVILLRSGKSSATLINGRIDYAAQAQTGQAPAAQPATAAPPPPAPTSLAAGNSASSPREN